MRLSNWGQALDSKRGIMCKKIICFLILPRRLLLKRRWIQREAKSGRRRHLKTGAGGTLCLVSILLAVPRAASARCEGEDALRWIYSNRFTLLCGGRLVAFPNQCVENSAVVCKYSEYLYPGEGGSPVLTDGLLCLHSFNQIHGMLFFFLNCFLVHSQCLRMCITA